ncbi:MAG: hypothetical protein LBH60_07910, partial [Prevotellaceae bacterium]|nr:hypothetical protein [Prevotellaceae bacterium]
TVVAFSSCSKDEDNGNGNSSKIEGNKLTVAVENGASHNSKIDLVKAEIWYGDEWTEYTVATAPYSNGKFTLNLPASVDAKYLDAVTNELSEGVTVSNRSAKIAVVEGLAAYKSDNHVGDIYYTTGNREGDWWATLIYADADVSVTGTSTQTYDDGAVYTYKTKYNVHLKRGWNMVYNRETAKNEGEVTSTATAGLKWYVDYYNSYDDTGSLPKNVRPVSILRRARLTATR